MVSNVIRCTQWKVITIILDKCDPYTQWYKLNSYFLQLWGIKSYLSVVTWERLPLSVGVTFVKNDCNDLPLSVSDPVSHHPSLVHTYFPLIMQCRASRVPRECSVRYPRHPGGSEVHYKGKYVYTTDGWCQTWSDAPDGRSLQSFLTNVIPTLSGTRPPAILHYISY